LNQVLKLYQISFKLKYRTEFQLLFKIHRDLDKVYVTKVAPNILFHP
jgi:hypothetical protein